MRRTPIVSVLLVLALAAPLEAQRRRLPPPGHQLTVLVVDYSDVPCTGLNGEPPASGVTVDVTAPRIRESAVTGRDGRAIFTLPTGTYRVDFSKGAWSYTVEAHPVSSDAMFPWVHIGPQSASAWDLAVVSGDAPRARENEPFAVRARVRWVDRDATTYVDNTTIVLERIEGWGSRGAAETVTTWYVPPLCDRESEWFVHQESGLPAGLYTYRARLQTPDRNRRNDVAEIKVQVTPPPRPDLALSVSQSHDVLGASETMRYTVNVANPGTGPASEVVVRAHVSPNLDFVAADGSHGLTCSPAGTNALGLALVCSGGEIPARRTATIHVDASLAGTAQPGHVLQFVVRADPDEVIDEIDEGNNHRILQATTGAPPRPDLALSIEQSGAVIPAGKSIRYSVSIANAGGTVASGIHVRSRLSPNLDFVYADGSDGFVCSTGGTNLLGLAVECTGGAVGAGETGLIEIVGSLPATANAGHQVRFVARADPDEAIDESDESNNHQTVEATTGEPVLVEHVVDGREFALAAHEAGWSSFAAKVEGPPMGTCSMDQDGGAGLTNVPLVNVDFLVCDYSYFASTGGSRRLAAPWTLVSVDMNFSPSIRSQSRRWTSSPQSGSDNLFFSFRLQKRVRVNLEDAAGLDRVILLGPEGDDWRDALR